tara:strand:+ start:131 stop:430 length:300 start_codon:yes stop_codon:yes gene_type:complete
MVLKTPSWSGRGSGSPWLGSRSCFATIISVAGRDRSYLSVKTSSIWDIAINDSVDSLSILEARVLSNNIRVVQTSSGICFATIISVAGWNRSDSMSLSG